MHSRNKTRSSSPVLLSKLNNFPRLVLAKQSFLGAAFSLLSCPDFISLLSLSFIVSVSVARHNTPDICHGTIFEFRTGREFPFPTNKLKKKANISFFSHSQGVDKKWDNNDNTLEERKKDRI